ncbi:hypothetical protein CMUST_00895 [Corynebacterium mustelae]|uniref:Uncharacterized protein n=1 Tax=Corynebacterium mustelae TaxID=571915 RepID=A0A0G3GVF9_9CORY|nr:hypothetical protein CMUST_00895 [Corynebacterium mustelae]
MLKFLQVLNETLTKLALHELLAASIVLNRLIHYAKIATSINIEVAKYLNILSIK